MDFFGEYNGQKVGIIRLKSEKLAAEVLTYGAALRALWVPGRDGKLGTQILPLSQFDDIYARCLGALALGLAEG